MKFSIIMPTYHAEKTLEKNLKFLDSERDLINEIIILDNGSKDRTLEIAKNYNAVIVNIPRQEFDHGGTRNIGAKKATGDILCYLNGDVELVNDSLLKEWSKVFNDPDVGGAYGRQLPRKDAVPIERLWRRFAYKNKTLVNTLDSLKKDGVNGLMFSTACAAIRKDLFDQIGGFKEHIIRNEDMLIAWNLLKMGKKTVYAPNALVRHSHNYSLKHSFQQYFDIGVFFAHHPEILERCGNTNEGFGRMLRGVKILTKEGHFFHIPQLLLESTMKFLGYTLGKNFDKLPMNVRKAFSKNKNYWDKETQ